MNSQDSLEEEQDEGHNLQLKGCSIVNFGGRLKTVLFLFFNPQISLCTFYVHALYFIIIFSLIQQKSEAYAFAGWTSEN